jgi:hypothetical protein
VPFPLEESQLSASETKLGVKFPASFKQRMMRENGGEVETGDDAWELHPFLDASDKKRLARTCNDIIRETETAKGWKGFPADAIAIGANGCGDRLILRPDAVNPAALGATVYWWDHETGQVHKVADDFSELS